MEEIENCYLQQKKKEENSKNDDGEEEWALWKK